MEYVEGINEETGGSCGGKCGGNLCSDMSAFSHTGNDELATTVKNGLYGTVKVFCQSWYQGFNGAGLVVEALCSNFGIS